MNRTVALPWGGGSLELRLPEQWTVLGELKPRSVPAPVDIAQVCAEALRDPIGAKPLDAKRRAGQKVVIVVDDHSRPTPAREFIRPIMDTLASAGVRDEQVEFLVATGVHRTSRPEEIECKLGPEVLSRFRWRCHNAYDPDALAYIGDTSRGTRVLLNKLLAEADLIVCVGSLEPHLLLGFGGGLKMLIPGCAAAETIGRNHLQGIDTERFNYVGIHGDDGRIVGEEILAAEGFHEPLLDFVLGSSAVAGAAADLLKGGGGDRIHGVTCREVGFDLIFRPGGFELRHQIAGAKHVFAKAAN